MTSSPILSPSTRVRCSAIQHRQTHRDDTSRFKRFHPRYVLDGTDKTFWAGGYNGSQECWIEVILPEEHVITHVDVQFRYAAEVALQALVDGIWITAKSLKAPDCPKDQTVTLSEPTFMRPVKRLRLAETKRHPSELDETKQNYNLYNCGMEVQTFQLKGYPCSAASVDHDESPAVFFSYNWAHQELVSQLAFETENAMGVKVWQDIGQMGGGDSLLMSVLKGMTEAEALVCCMSKQYAKSVNCQKEIAMANELGIPVVQLLFDEADLDFLRSDNTYLAQALAKHLQPIKVESADEDALSAIAQGLNIILKERQHGTHNALPLFKTTAPTHAVVDFSDISDKRSSKVAFKSHENSVVELTETSPRHDLALGRPCNSSGNFYR